MATDYILFVHGVNTREVREQPEYAAQLFDRIQKSVSGHKRDVKKVALYWGDVNINAETQLLTTLKSSPLWEQIWFREFREKQLLQFAGDAALYISRHIGSKVVNKLKTQALDALKNHQPDARLHLVTHSWGTVILFDVLFAALALLHGGSAHGSYWQSEKVAQEIKSAIARMAALCPAAPITEPAG